MANFESVEGRGIKNVKFFKFEKLFTLAQETVKRKSSEAKQCFGNNKVLEQRISTIQTIKQKEKKNNQKKQTTKHKKLNR